MNHLLQHPKTVHPIEHELLDRLGFQINFLHNGMLYGGALLHALHFLLAIEQQGVVILVHEEILHLPLAFTDVAHFIATHHLQREFHP